MKFINIKFKYNNEDGLSVEHDTDFSLNCIIDQPKVFANSLISAINESKSHNVPIYIILEEYER